MDIEWADVLRASLSFFLVVVGIGIAYVCFRLGGVLRRMSVSVVRVTDEVVPILSRAQTTVDGINLELSRVDEIMVSAVNATKGAEKTVTSISNAVTTPVKKASGWASAAKEAMATFRARRAESHVPAEVSEDATQAATLPDTGPPASVDVDHSTQPAAPAAPADPAGPEGKGPQSSGLNGSTEAPEGIGERGRGPSLSQISWALPKRRS